MPKYFVTSKLSENMHLTPEGFLVCIGVPIARTGEMLYGEGETPLETDDEGKVIIMRDEAEVFRPETLASFEGKPLTISHPTEFVGPDNWTRLAKGTIQNVRRGKDESKDDLIADILITDGMAINLVRSGLREVSCGYEAEYIQMEDGKGKQINIIGNHLALVDQGRAGSAYAINDHKGVIKMPKLSERIKAIFAKAQDEAMKVAEDEAEAPKKEEKKDDAKDAGAYDELVKMCADLGEKISAMAKPKDAEGEAAGASGEKDMPEKKDDAKDDDPMAALEDRLKALEASVAKLLEAKAGDAEEGEESEESEDADEGEEESEDDDFEESSMVGDTASRIEILAPGLKPGKNAKAAALKVAFGTEAGKKIIESLSGGKAPTFDSKEVVDTLFIAASELMKAQRNGELSRTKATRDSSGESGSTFKSAADINAINAKFYARN